VVKDINHTSDELGSYLLSRADEEGGEGWEGVAAMGVAWEDERRLFADTSF